MVRLNLIFKKYKSIILYLFFGICSTIINIFVYALMFELFNFSNVFSVIVAWIFAVLFAFITNKIWVFESNSFSGKLFIKELLSFFLCRGITGFLDVAIMYVTVDLMGWNAILWKIIANVIVVILNYAASKILIFRKN